MGFTGRLDIVAKLGSDYDVFAPVGKGFRYDLFAVASTVSIGGIEECYALVGSLLEQVDAVGFVHLAPPVYAHAPHTESYF